MLYFLMVTMSPTKVIFKGPPMDNSLLQPVFATLQPIRPSCMTNLQNPYHLPVDLKRSLNVI